jgi:hypothetical protein
MSVGDALSHELNRPLGDSSHYFSTLDHLPEREGGHNRDWVRLKVVVQLSLGDEDSVQELLDLGVACLGVR